MQHIAADRHGQPFEAPLSPPDGQRIEQRLSGVLVRAIACVDHRGIDLLRQQVRRTRLIVPHGADSPLDPLFVRSLRQTTDVLDGAVRTDAST